MEFLERVADWTAGNWQAPAGYGASVAGLVSPMTVSVPRLRLVCGARYVLEL